MDLQFILQQLLEQRNSLDNIIRALEELIRQQRERSTDLFAARTSDSSDDFRADLVCRWCRRSFVSAQWSPVCEAAECQEREAVLREQRQSGKSRRGRKAGGASG